MNTFRLDQQISDQQISEQQTISAVDKATILWAIKVALEATNNPDEIDVYKKTLAKVRKMRTK